MPAPGANVEPYNDQRQQAPQNSDANVEASSDQRQQEQQNSVDQVHPNAPQVIVLIWI